MSWKKWVLLPEQGNLVDLYSSSTKKLAIGYDRIVFD